MYFLVLLSFCETHLKVRRPVLVRVCNVELQLLLYVNLSSQINRALSEPIGEFSVFNIKELRFHL